jgi:general nucleoside transport system permease protein
VCFVVKKVTVYAFEDSMSSPSANSDEIYIDLDPIIDALLPVFAVLAALLVGAVMLVLMGTNPITAYKSLFDGAFGSNNSFANTLVKATPLLLVGLGICISFRGGVINIGGEGQMIVGALLTVIVALEIPNTRAAILLPLSLLAGFVGGAVWGGIAGALKAYFNVNEILSTVMLNQVAVYLMIYLLNHNLMDPVQRQNASRIPQTARLPDAAQLPRIWRPTLLHIGVIIAVVLAVLVYILLWRTIIGYRIRAVGKNARASRYAGIKVKRYVLLSLLLSGGFSGLAGATLVLGGISHRMVTDGSASGFTGSAGFNGIVAALFGQLHPILTIPAAFFFGAMLVGGQQLQRDMQVPSSLITVLNGLIIVFVVSTEIWQRKRARRRVSANVADSSETKSEETVS